jgi:hypothetical protein
MVVRMIAFYVFMLFYQEDVMISDSSAKASATAEPIFAEMSIEIKTLRAHSDAMPRTKTNAPSATESARAARRRATWNIVVADSFAEAEAETRAYWRNATPAERLNALEKLREPFYGKDQIGGRLQRFLEVVPAE